MQENQSKGKGVAYQGAREEFQVQGSARPRVPLDKIPTIPTSMYDSMTRVDPLPFNTGAKVSKSYCDGTSLRELYDFLMVWMCLCCSLDTLTKSKSFSSMSIRLEMVFVLFLRFSLFFII
jgi:hypothetical protein